MPKTNKDSIDLPTYIAMQRMYQSPYELAPSPYVMPPGGMQIDPNWPNYEGNVIEQFLQQRTDLIPWLSHLFTGREPYNVGI